MMSLHTHGGRQGEDREAAVAATAEAFERAITRLTWLERKLFAVQLEAFDLTPAQYHALVHASRRGHACTMGCLADDLHQSSATTTGIVDRLVRRGLAERCDDPSDRRRVIVRLTDSGAWLLGEVGAYRRRHTVAVLSRVAAADRERLIALLEAYLDLVAERIGEREAAP